MFLRKDTSVIHSTNINPYVNLTYSHKLPFILRLTDKNSLPFDKKNIILQHQFGKEE